MNAQQKLLAEAASHGLPMMMGNPLDYVPLAYYHRSAPVELVGVIDTELARRYTGTDSSSRDLAVLSRHSELRVEDFTTFSAKHSEFLFLTRPGIYNWWTPYLIEHGYSLTAVHQADVFTLFKVRPGAASIAGR